MKLCQECGTPLAGRQKRFCSISCRNRPLGRKSGGWNEMKVKVVCQNCDEIFKVPLCRATTARACSRKCLGALQSRERKGKLRPELGIQTYRRARKGACERCGATEKLCVHHKDENRRNNDLSNLETLCRRCHAIHHDVGSWAPKGPRGPRTLFPRPCERCGATFKPIRQVQRYCSRQCWLVVRNSRPAA